MSALRVGFTMRNISAIYAAASLVELTNLDASHASMS
jgi:hypothetical protein